MDKKLILYLITLIFITGCADKSVQLDGTLLDPINGEYLYLEELTASDLITVDSIMIQDDGTFHFDWKVKHPSFYIIKISDINFINILAEPGQKISLKTHFDSLNYPISVDGSKGTELMIEYNRVLKETIDRLTGLNDVYMQNIENPDLPSVIERLDSLANIYLDEINSYTKNYIDDNLSSLISLVALYQQVAPNVYVLSPTRDLDYFLKVDSSMISSYPDYEPVLSLHEQVQVLTAGSNPMTGSSGSLHGTEAPEISLPTPEGDTIRLSSTRGSVVLLDFWASWCTPCRQESSNLVKAYDLFHEKGFQIYQVSLDKTKEAWMKGIADDKLGRWIHVSDVMYWNSVVVPQYNIEGIPYNFLLDREGRIIASNLRGEQLQNKLAELFGD